MLNVKKQRAKHLTSDIQYFKTRPEEEKLCHTSICYFLVWPLLLPQSIFTMWGQILLLKTTFLPLGLCTFQNKTILQFHCDLLILITYNNNPLTRVSALPHGILNKLVHGLFVVYVESLLLCCFNLFSLRQEQLEREL